MMKIIVADDEKWVRAAIIKLIPFNDLGLTLAAEASNGLEALDFCKQHKPDILITDICMPGLSGLELIEEIKTLLPEIKIIIISGYSDFEYAKKALQCGVSDYLLKPVDQSELVNLLIKLRDSLIHERQQVAEDSLVKQRYQEALPIVCENFLNQLIRPNSLVSEYIKNELRKYDIHFSYPYFTIAVMASDRTQHPSPPDHKIYIEKVLRRSLLVVTLSPSPDDGTLISIINHSDGDQSTIFKALALCIRLYNKRFTQTISVGVSNAVQRIHLLPHIFIEAREALNARFWREQEHIYLYGNSALSRDFIPKFPEGLIDNLLLDIKLSNLPQETFYLEAFFKDLAVNTHVHPDLVKESLWALIQSLIVPLGMQLSFIEYEILVTGVHPYEGIRCTDTFEHLLEYIRDLIARISDHYHCKKPNIRTNPVEAAKAIISQNYHMDISLEQLSGYVHLSPTYFSELFKKETGMSFIDYKTLVRIENAKKLLESTDLSLHEISSRVGYTDPKYFSKLFKKITGITQQEFRQKTIPSE